MSLILQETVVVPHQCERRRLSDIAMSVLKSLPSNKSIKKAVKGGFVFVDGCKGNTGDFICGGEKIELFRDEGVVKKPTVNIFIEVIYEDDYLAVVYKPPGLLVSGNKKFTLENALPLCIKLSEAKDALSRPEPIHRLDYPTSGALLIGKTVASVITLNKIFEERKIQKQYIAVTIGKMNVQGMVETIVDGKFAKSAYQVLHTVKSEKYSRFNLVELTLFTGRRHQLRIHMSSLGNPILGDVDYGIEGLILKGKGLYLHSRSLSFEHPLLNEMMVFKASLPSKYLKLFPDGDN